MPGHRGNVKIDFISDQLFGGGLHITVGQLDFGAQAGQTFQVQVDGPGPDGAAPGQGHARFFQTGQQGPQNQDGCPHFADQVIGGFMVGKTGGIDFDRMVRILDPGAQIFQEQPGASDIHQPGHIVKGVAPVRQEGGHQDRQGGVFGAADINFTGQPAAALDENLVHATS